MVDASCDRLRRRRWHFQLEKKLTLIPQLQCSGRAQRRATRALGLYAVVEMHGEWVNRERGATAALFAKVQRQTVEAAVERLDACLSIRPAVLRGAVPRGAG